MLSRFQRDVGGNLFCKRFERHGPKILIATCSNCDCPGSFLFVAKDKDVGQLLQRMLSYFIRNLLVAQIEVDSKPLIFQRFGNFSGVISLCIGDRQHRYLYRRQPDWQRHRGDVVR